MLYNLTFPAITFHDRKLVNPLIFVTVGTFAEEDIGRQGIASSVAGNAAASRGLEVAVANLQDYCNGANLLLRA